MEKLPYNVMFISVSKYTGNENGIQNTNKCQKTKRIVDSVKNEIQNNKPILYGGLFSEGNKYAKHAQEELQKVLEYAILPCKDIAWGLLDRIQMCVPRVSPDANGHVVIITDKETVKKLTESLELIPTPYGAILTASQTSEQ